METPDPNGIAEFQRVYDECVKFFARHLVCLFCSYVQLDKNGKRIGDEKLAAFSGFVMSFGDEWFFVTAGHALKEGIDEKLQSGLVQLRTVGFHDGLGGQAKHKHPTIIDYDSAPRFYVDDHDLGLDVGMIHLRPFYRAGLEANGIVPIREENWTHQPAEVLSNYFLFGIPEELTSPVTPTTGVTGKMLSATVNPLLLPVQHTGVPHKELPSSVYPWFIGQVDLLFGLKNICGMSGGPIFGFKQMPDGQWVYWVVALQSWWDGVTRTVYGCPVPIFAELVQGFINSISEDA